jgi:hypothetical protein
LTLLSKQPNHLKLKPSKDAPLKRPTDKDPSSSALLLQLQRESPTIGFSQLSGELQTDSSLISVHQHSVTDPSPTMTSTSSSITILPTPSTTTSYYFFLLYYR